MDEENHDTKDNSDTEETENLISFFDRRDFVVGLIPPIIMFIEWLFCKFLNKVAGNDKIKINSIEVNGLMILTLDGWNEAVKSEQLKSINRLVRCLTVRFRSIEPSSNTLELPFLTLHKLYKKFIKFKLIIKLCFLYFCWWKKSQIWSIGEASYGIMASAK